MKPRSLTLKHIIYITVFFAVIGVGTALYGIMSALGALVVCGV